MENTELKTLGPTIRLKRENGLTQNEVAEKPALIETISEWSNEVKKPSYLSL